MHNSETHGAGALAGESPASLSRRRMFQMLALTGAGLVASSSNASAFFNFFEAFAPAEPVSLDTLAIPDEWRARLGSNLRPYATFLNSMKFRNFSVKEVIAPHTKTHGGVNNTLPPKQFWRNIRNTVKVIDSLSSRLDLEPREFVSVYRSPAYNAKCYGAKKHSYHLVNNAIDIKYPCSPGKVRAMAREMRSAGIFTGGIGSYPGFTHIDTRGAKADW